MKTFVELFTDARRVSTPLIAVRTFDAASTIANVTKSLADTVKDTPLVAWDSLHGLKGLNDGVKGAGQTAVAGMCSAAGMEVAATVDLPIALGVLEFANEDVVCFLHNPHLVWSDPRVIQGVWNLRDRYKADGNLLVLLIGAGDILPTELQQDVLVLDEPLPTRDELVQIVQDMYNYSSQNPNYKACSKEVSQSVIKAACDALIGLSAFPAEQAVAMELEKTTGVLDTARLWERKKSIVSQIPGLTFLQPKETLADMFGNVGFAKFATAFMEGDYAPNVILRTDEIEKQFAGNGTDSSGSTGKQLGEFLSWIEDKEVVCTLLLGVPGSSKSWSSTCIAGHYGRPLIKFDLSAMEDKHVGEGGKNLRNAERTVEAISDGKIWLIATANSLRGLPPELISRFQIGGIFFFDAPTENEKRGIMNLKVKRYKREQQIMPDMTGWTGRDINNCARKAQLLNVSLVDAGKFIVPLMKSHKEEMDALRASAHGRFLSASHEGVYEYHNQPEPTVIKAVEGRKMRT